MNSLNCMKGNTSNDKKELQFYCKTCNERNGEVVKVEIPYVFRLIQNQLRAAGIGTKITAE
jgi:hypothetical protein